MKRIALAVYVLLCVCAPVTPRVLDAHQHLRAKVGSHNDLMINDDDDAVHQVLASGIAVHCLQLSWNDDDFADDDPDDDSSKQFVYKQYVFSRRQLNDMCKALVKRKLQ